MELKLGEKTDSKSPSKWGWGMEGGGEELGSHDRLRGKGPGQVKLLHGPGRLGSGEKKGLHSSAQLRSRQLKRKWTGLFRDQKKPTCSRVWGLATGCLGSSLNGGLFFTSQRLSEFWGEGFCGFETALWRGDSDGIPAGSSGCRESFGATETSSQCCKGEEQGPYLVPGAVCTCGASDTHDAPPPPSRPACDASRLQCEGLTLRVPGRPEGVRVTKFV